ncbi:D-glucuronyl C5-epimerase [Nautilia profundicola AmH]|uniref:D-glucuronyl C5-epimerase n=1 Tax=Nautilia profundicola (strain ATCC BAA-1463 / DSM 18972 / AmH) TaxID=598659 RepID=B9L6P9_NAUPA|nr:D-glucuronyl C5-epimerase family protein [Nautilia profundicola]ACM92804.1 D-glucuronyl C5-epimerase [Nautilia profundicola AmH]
MRLNKSIFYIKKLLRDFFNPLIYEIKVDKNKQLLEYYFVFREKELLKGGSQNFHFDNKGIPIIPTYIDIEEKKFHYYPIAIGQYALAIYHTYLETKSNKDKERFKLLADWFINNQTKDGYWLSSVEEKKYKLSKNWVSSMTQGRVISVLLRASQLFDDKKYEIAASKALDTFSDSSKFINYFDNNIFYEEYPSTPGSFVLNGMIFSLWGLYDYIRYNNNEKANIYFNNGINSLKSMIDLYDLGYWSCYDLRHLTWGEKYLNPATVHYHFIHINQLKVLGELIGEQIFIDYSLKWEKYVNLFNKVKMYVNKYTAIKNR